MAQVVTIRQEKPLSWKEHLALFALTLKAQGRAPRTISDYVYEIGHFFARFPDALESHEKGKLAALSFLADDSIGPITFNHRLTYLRVFFRWLMSEGITARNPFDGIGKRKERSRIVDVDMGTITALLALPDQTTWTGKRDYALMLFSVDTGARPGESLQLQPADFDLARAEVAIPAHIAKTRTPRSLPMSAQTVKAIRALLDIRHPLWKASVPVFSTRDGTLMLETTWGQRFRTLYALRLGKSITPYSLRHAAATLLLRSGANAFAVQALLGHSTPYMTQRYVHLVSSDLKDQHARFSPIGQIVGERQRVKRKV